MKPWIYLFLSLSLILANCSSGKRALKKGNYITAIDQSINKLRKKPNHKKASKVLPSAYVRLKQQTLKRIETFNSNSSDPFRFEKIADQYYVLANAHDKIKNLEVGEKLIPNLVPYWDEYSEYALQASNYRLELGNKALNKGSKESARDALIHFKKAEFYNLDLDLTQQIETARYIAAVKVEVYPPIMSIKSFQYSNDKFVENLKRQTDTRIVNEHIWFYFPEDLQELPENDADQVLEIEFLDFVVGNLVLKERTQELKKDSVTVVEKTRNGSTTKVLRNVTAEYTEYEKYINSEGTIRLTIQDLKTKRTLLNKTLTGGYTWMSEWAEFSGNVHALSEDQLEKSKLRELNPPPQLDLFEEFTKPLTDQIFEELQRFYRKF